MKYLKIASIMVFIFLLNTASFSQHKQKGGKRTNNHGINVKHHKNRVIVVKQRSHYRPNKIVVYHPYWHPNHSYNRRWLYFPRYNFYWDNWRNHYVYYDGGVWVSQPTAPAIIININLDKEKNYELKESEEDDDDVYKTNAKHKTEFKPE